MIRSNFSILEFTDDRILLKDLGPWNRYRTITNDAENVIEHLHKTNRCGKRRVIYKDSGEDLTELLHDGNGNFLGFNELIED